MSERYTAADMVERQSLLVELDDPDPAVVSAMIDSIFDRALDEVNQAGAGWSNVDYMLHVWLQREAGAPSGIARVAMDNYFRTRRRLARGVLDGRFFWYTPRR